MSNVTYTVGYLRYCISKKCGKMIKKKNKDKGKTLKYVPELHRGN